MKKVSVIIPVYNVERYLRQCLDSVVNQTLKDIEIICINDCSTDGSLQILKEYAQNDNRIKLVNLDKNIGLGAARNRAFEFVSGDYIMYLDSDDWLELNACELAYNQIKQNNNDLVYFGIYISDENNNYKREGTARLAMFKKYWNQSNIKYSDIDEPFMSYCECWYKIYKTEFVKNHGLKFETGKRYEDMTFYYDLIMTNADLSILNVPLYNYRKSPKQITNNPEYWNDLIFVRNKVLNKILALKNEKYLKFYIIAYINSVLFHYKKFSDIDSKFELEYFEKIKNILEELSSYVNLEEIKNYINYKKYLSIINSNYFKKKMLLFGRKIFYMKNTENRKYKVINIIGAKIKLNMS